MSGAARTLDQADMDLQRAMDLFDTALTSKDERVVNALRSLLMIVALTDPETGENDHQTGPLRAMERDLNGMHSRIRSLEDNLRQVVEALSRNESATRKYGWDKNHTWPSQTSDTFYMDNYLKRMNGGSI